MFKHGYNQVKEHSERDVVFEQMALLDYKYFYRFTKN